YLRVHGRAGAYSVAAPFTLSVSVIAGPCAGVMRLPSPALDVPARGVKTLVLTDLVDDQHRLSRMAGSPDEHLTLRRVLDAFAARPEVGGEVFDVASDASMLAAEKQADSHPGCPFALNVTADTIKR